MSVTLQSVPAAAWAAIVAAIAGGLLALTGVLLNQWHARKLQASQLKHDSEERSLERQMAWRRDVYLDAAEAVSRLSSILGSASNLNVADAELTRIYQDDVAKLNKMQLIASDKTVQSLNVFLEEYVIMYIQITVERMLLIAQRNEIDSLEATTKGIIQALQATSADDEVLRTDFQEAFQRRQKIANHFQNGQFALVKRSMEAASRLAPLLLPALLYAREELGIPLDSTEYMRQSREMNERLVGVANEIIKKIERATDSDDPLTAGLQ